MLKVRIITRARSAMALRFSQRRGEPSRIAVIAAQAQIVLDRHAGHAAVLQRLLGQHPDRLGLRLVPARGIGLAHHQHLAAGGLPLAGNDLDQFDGWPLPETPATPTISLPLEGRS